MTKLLGTILAMVLALNGSIAVLPVEAETQVLLGVLCGVLIAGLTYYLRDNATPPG